MLSCALHNLGGGYDFVMLMRVVRANPAVTTGRAVHSITLSLDIHTLRTVMVYVASMFVSAAIVCLISAMLMLFGSSISSQLPVIFEISEKSSVLVDDTAMDTELLSETWQLLQASLKQSGWSARDLMGRSAEIPSAACNQLQIVAKMRGHVDHGAFPQCHAPRTSSCRYLLAGFADAVPVTHNATDDGGLIAYISLHEQWASNWGGEVAFSESGRGSRLHPRGGALTFLPRPGRALLFDAGAPHAWHLPTRHAQPVDLRARPAPLAFPAETGVAELLQIAFVCEKQHTDVPHLLPRMPPGHLRGGMHWTPLPSGGANLAYGAHERLMLFDQAWPESAQRWLSELATQATELRSERRRERSDRRSLRYHDAIPLTLEGANDVFYQLQLAALINASLGCHALQLQRAYWNLQSFVDMNEPHQDADEVTQGAEAFTALLYPHARWYTSWLGHTVFLTPDLGDILYQAAPLPRRLLLFSGTIPHFARPATRSADPFRNEASESAGIDEAVNATGAHQPAASSSLSRLSLAFKLTCERTEIGEALRQSWGRVDPRAAAKLLERRPHTV